MNGEVILSVSHGDWCELDVCKVYIDEVFSAHAAKMCSEVRRLGVYKIVEFDGRAIPLIEEEDEDGDPILVEDHAMRLECECANYTDRGVFWSGYVKHSDVRWETGYVPLDRLEDPATTDLDLREY